MIRWNRDGYDIVFTTRLGGVSEGPYASLNLGVFSDDDPRCVEENLQRTCGVVGADPSRVAVNRQVHSAVVHEARPGRRGVEGDGLATSEADLPLLALAADCIPVALVSTSGARRLVVLHAGWRGLAAGIVEAGVAALGTAHAAALVGPSIGPCCYAVGDDVAARFDADLTHGGRLDLWAAAARRLEAAGVAVERLDLCTWCHPDLFFSHRRDNGSTGRQGVLGVVR